MEDTPTIDSKAKRPRYDRRLEKRKQAQLNKLVVDFFTQRSGLLDPNGEKSAKLFDFYEKIWHNECKNFNVHRTPFKLKYEAFLDNVNYFMDMEKKKKAQTADNNKLIGFEHWFRRVHPYMKYPFRAIWIEIISLFRRDVVLKHWQQFYKELNESNR
jgi:hypothetical protein